MPAPAGPSRGSSAPARVLRRSPLAGPATLAATVAAVLATVLALWLVSVREAGADQHLVGETFDFGIAIPGTPITAGDTIVFTNTGDRPHTITDRGNTFDTDGILPGDTTEVTFDAPGTYALFCRINPGSMNATVVVEPGDEPPTEVRVQALDPARDGEALRFDPDTLEVRPGTRVTVANVGGAPHTLTADDGSFDTDTIDPGAEEGRFAGDHVTFVAEEAGTFDFRCLVHPEAMTGTLTVAGDPLDGDAADPPLEEPPDPGGGATAAAAVAILDFSFDPVEVAVLPGAEVTWTNVGNAPHTATFDDVEGRVEGLDTGTLGSGSAASLVAPDAPGSYSYLCTIHPAMRGVLVVAAAGDEAAADDASPEIAAEQPAAAPPADGGDLSPAALVGAIAILVAGAGAIMIAMRGRRLEPTAEPTADGTQE